MKCFSCSQDLIYGNTGHELTIAGEGVICCSSCCESFNRINDETVPEIGDTAEFIALDAFGPTTGEGTIMRLFKNGGAIIHKDGYNFKTHHYYILRKAG